MTIQKEGGIQGMTRTQELWATLVRQILLEHHPTMGTSQVGRETMVLLEETWITEGNKLLALFFKQDNHQIAPACP